MKKLILVAVVLVALAGLGVAEATGGAYAFLTKWGSLGSGAGQFDRPHGIAVDSAGNVYVADNANNRIQKFTSTGAFLAEWGSLGSGAGQFNRPYAVAVDSAGNVYVVDNANNRVQKFTSTGAFLTEWGSYGPGDGQLNWPVGIAIDSSGDVYITEMYSHRVQKFSGTGVYLTKWGYYGGGDGQFAYPYGIAVDSADNVYVADIYNYRVQKFSSTGSFLGKWGSYGSGDGQFSNPTGVAVGPAGNVYVTDIFDHRVQKFDSTGTFLTAWGSAGSGDGQFDRPYGIAVDPSGNVYVADSLNNRIQVFTSDTTPPVITPSIAGTAGSNGWYTSDVTVTWSVVDNESAITSTSGCGPTTVNYDTAGVTLTCEATSAGGTASESVTVKRDATPPTTTALATLAEGGSYTPGNWTKSNVTVALNATDNEGGSGVAVTEYKVGEGSWATYTGPLTVSTEGITNVLSRSTDNAGNVGPLGTLEVRIDKTAPTITRSIVSGPYFISGPNTHVTSETTLRINVTDSVSAVSSCTISATRSDGVSNLACGTGDNDFNLSGQNGSRIVTVMATDNAGNSVTFSENYILGNSIPSSSTTMTRGGPR